MKQKLQELFKKQTKHYYESQERKIFDAEMSEEMQKKKEQQELNQILAERFQEVFNDDNDAALIQLEKLALLRNFHQLIINDPDLEAEYSLYRKNVKPNIFLDVIETDRIGKMLLYIDEYPLLDFRKSICISLIKISNICFKIIKHSVFETITLMIIIFNSIILALNDPTDQSQSSFENQLDLMFMILYTVEMSLKIFGLGFILNKGSYLRDYWNILDFIIVMSGYLTLLQGNSSIDLTALRSLRILRPLRTISSIPSLKEILSSLFSALSLLKDSIIIYTFFMMIFAIAGLQLFMGYLKKRCINSSYGIKVEQFCRDSGDCKTNQFCGKTMENPLFDTISFDTFGWSFLQVFVISTQEGWTYIMYSIWKTFSEFGTIYFLIVVFIQSFFLINLTLAIIKVKFSEEKSKNEFVSSNFILQKKKKNFIEGYELSLLKKIGLFIPSKEKGKRIKRKQPIQLNNALMIDQPNKNQTLNKIHHHSASPKTNKNHADKSAHDFSSKLVSEQFGYKNNKNYYQKGFEGIKIKKNLKPVREDLFLQNLDIHLFRKQLDITNTPLFMQTEKINSNSDRTIMVKHLDSVQPKSNQSLLREKVENEEVSDLSIKKSDQADQDIQNQSVILKNFRDLDLEDEYLKEKIDRGGFRKRTFKNNHKLIVVEEKQEKNHTQIANENENEEDDIEILKLKTELNPEYLIPRVRFDWEQQFHSTEDVLEKQIKRKLIDDQRLKDEMIRKKKVTVIVFSKIIQNIDQQKEVNELFYQQNHGMNGVLDFREYEVKTLLNERRKKIPINRQFAKERTQNFLSLEKNVSSQQQKTEEYIINNIQINKNAKISKKEIKLTYQEAIEKISEILIVEEEQNKNEQEKEELNFEYNCLQQQDLQNPSAYTKIEWSGEEILLLPKVALYQQLQVFNYYLRILNSLNYNEYHYMIWLIGISGLITIFRKYIQFLCSSKIYDNLMISAVILNTIFLSLDGIVDQEDLLNEFNFAFTIIFTIDLSFKLIGLGIIEFLRDKMNIFDGVIVILSLIELIFIGGGKSSLSAFRSVRIFRTFRVLRVTRLIRQLQYMNVIIKVISNELQSFIYIFLLLILFLYIFALLGMQIFGGKLAKFSRLNFDSFLIALLTVFQIMTMENWNDLLVASLRSNAGLISTLIYFIVWIFIGNYVFLNLFLAILLEGFETKDLEQEINILEKDIVIKQNFELSDGLEKRRSGIVTGHLSNMTGETGISSEYSALQQTNKKKIQEDSFNQKVQLQKIQKEFQYFSENNLAINSFWIFSQKSTFRRLCYRIVKHQNFEWIILFAIFLSSIKLVIDTYESEIDNKIIIQIGIYLDLGFTIFYTIEAMMKAVAYGFIINQNSYLRESWSQLDFFIVITSWIDVAVTGVDLTFVKILRLLRTLRPLRFITHNINMKIVVTALLESVSGIINVVIVVLLVWIMFAIFGINVMKDKMHYCKIPSNSFQKSIYSIGQKECNLILGASWENYDLNFDNIGNGLITLFVLSTMEGWPDYMYRFIDAGDEYPIKDNYVYMALYFVIFIFVGSLFLINLFVGVIFLNYHMAEKKAKNEFLTENQSNWIEIQRLILKSDPYLSSYFPPQNKFRAFTFAIIKNKIFDTFIMVCIICNIVTMAMGYEGSSNNYEEILININLLFTAIFIFEALLKIITFGIKGYFIYGWNRFDFFVVLASIIDFVMDLFGQEFISFLKVGPQLARVFRVLRVTRLFRLIKSFQGLQQIIQTAIFSLPSLLNVASLLFLLFFISSILAVFLFKNIPPGMIINETWNFNNFLNAFQLLFRCATGENWYLIMFDTAHENRWNILFFLIFILLCQFIMLNLFVLVILQQFELNYINPDNPLQNFQDLETTYIETWVEFSKESKGVKIKDRYCPNLLVSLKYPLGLDFNEEFKKHYQQWKEHHNNHTNYQKEILEMKFKAIMKKKACKEIMEMNIVSDGSGFLTYHELLFYLMKRQMKQKVYDDILPKQLEIITKEEQITMNNLRIKKNSNKIFSSVNPLQQQMVALMSFLAWANYTKKIKLTREKRIKDGLSEAMSFSISQSDIDQVEKSFQIEERSSYNNSLHNSVIKAQFISIPNNEIYRNQSIDDNYFCNQFSIYQSQPKNDHPKMKESQKYLNVFQLNEKNNIIENNKSIISIENNLVSKSTPKNQLYLHLKSLLILQRSRDSEERQRSYALIQNNHQIQSNEQKKITEISQKTIENMKHQSNKNLILYSPKTKFIHETVELP